MGIRAEEGQIAWPADVAGSGRVSPGLEDQPCCVGAPVRPGSVGRLRLLAVEPILVEVGKDAGLGRLPPEQLSSDNAGCWHVELERSR